jgi:hypothetical protein
VPVRRYREPHCTLILTPGRPPFSAMNWMLAAIARSYVLENVSPRADETEDQRLEIDRVAASISHVADMADDLMKSYHAAIGSSRKART